MKRCTIGALGSTVLALCAIGCSEQEDCRPTLEEWCGDEGCAARPDLDEALAEARAARGFFNSAQHCGNRVVIGFSGGYTGSTLVYDATTGELVGGASFTDVLTDDACENEMMSAGEPTTCEGATCKLLGSRVSADNVEADACQGELAEPFIEACLAAPAEMIAGCEECACTACYPTLLPSRELGVELLPAAVACLKQHCPDECGAIDGIQ